MRPCSSPACHRGRPLSHSRHRLATETAGATLLLFFQPLGLLFLAAGSVPRRHLMCGSAIAADA